MRNVFIIVFLLPFFLFSQKKTDAKIDSLDFYFDLVKFNKRDFNYKNCLGYSQKAIDYAIKIKNQKAIADSYSNLGTIYMEIKKYNDAIDSFVKSIAIYSTLPNSAKQAYTHYNIGICYMEMDNFSMAEQNFNQSKAIYEKIKISGATDMLNLQRGILYREKGNIEMAMPLFENIISKTDNKDTYKLVPDALYQIGIIESNRKRYNLAINYFDRASKLNDGTDNLELQTKIILGLSQAYEKSMLSIDKSYDFLKQYITLKDSLTNLNTKKIGLEDFASFKDSEKLKLIEQIDREAKTQQKANTFAKLISILAIALISILSLLSLSLYKNNIIRKQSNSLLQDKNEGLQIAKENAEKASKARSEFLSTVSHELRTPLNAINGITHLLIEDKPKENQIQYLNSLKFSGNYLLHFINDILEINRIESENVPIEKINCEFKLLLQNIKNSFNEIAHDNNNTFILEIDESIPDNLICDPTKLSQIFINLVNNSLKFTKDGFVKLTAKIEKAEDKNLVIGFKVADNGIGIPDDKQANIFDSFSQGSIEINRKYGGTGLGLAIVKKLIELLGGKIYLNSKVGLGTTFTFSLPFETGEKIVIEKNETTVNINKAKNKKILLVEDNKINQMITKKMLENKGMICEMVDSGEECIAILQQKHDFDLVLMDVHLLGINGTVATQQIRAFDTKIPIIALTAISLDENREMLLSYGMNNVITKPFEPEIFYKTIAEYFA